MSLMEWVNKDIPEIPELEALNKKATAKQSGVDEAREQIAKIEDENRQFNRALMDAQSTGDVKKIMQLESNPPQNTRTLAALREAEKVRKNEEAVTNTEAQEAWEKTKALFAPRIAKAKQEAEGKRQEYLDAIAELRRLEYQSGAVRVKFERLGDTVITPTNTGMYMSVNDRDIESHIKGKWEHEQ